VPVAIWIVISGLDDLFITLVGFATCRVPFPWPCLQARFHCPYAVTLTCRPFRRVVVVDLGGEEFQRLSAFGVHE
jgi:hypothetical protein